MGSITFTHIILVLIFFIHAANSSSDSGCIESEREALLEFKATCKNSTSLSSWTGRNCCSWYGITCHSLTGHIRTLQLDHYSHRFDGMLSPWLFNLTQLEDLRISTGLIGPIPNMFDKLTSLTYLDLSENDFDWGVFPDSLCSLTSLTYLGLGGYQLQGSLPFCLANMTSLTQLSLRGNELSGKIPDCLGNLTHLNTLDLSYNNFSSSLPSSLGNLKHLETLDASYNHLFGTIPSTLGNLTKLTLLFVNDNSLTGQLSESFFKGLVRLEDLDISRNYHLVFNVSSQWIPPILLSSLAMDSVFIGAGFPLCPPTQTKIGGLSMSNASISGAIPGDCLIAFPNLEYFDVSNNSLTGSIPTFHSALLFYLKLSSNQFNGNISTQFCNITNIQFLFLANNQLTGRIPSCFGNFTVLTLLDMGNNSLSGHIPSEFGSFKQRLQEVHLNENNLSGQLPASMQNLTALVNLDLGDNEFQGSIPQWIGKNWSRFKYLRLQSNNFSGEIPISFCQLAALHILNLAQNGLVGTIPPCLGNLTLDKEDSLGSLIERSLWNKFKGRELRYTSNLGLAKFISLSGNHLHGEIPAELMNLIELESLDLSNNELIGMIPKTINNLKNLESLDLSMNRLSGTIPQSLADVDFLGYLNLSFNLLAGRIPSGNHFDTLYDPSIYQGNSGLCGKMLMTSCPGDDDLPKGAVVSEGDVDGDEVFELPWFYAGIGPGFAVGLLGVICILWFLYCYS